MASPAGLLLWGDLDRDERGGDATLVRYQPSLAACAFKAQALARLAAQHDEITRLRQQAGGIAKVRHLPTRAPGTRSCSWQPAAAAAPLQEAIARTRSAPTSYPISG
jgi:hypothetical protein